MKIEGTVVRGKQIGRTLGFPTANVQAEFISGSGPDGVYAALFIVDGSTHFCMVNIGHHPTLPEGGKTIEAHVFDYTGDLYGRRVTIETTHYLRGEQRFSSPEELRLQLERDKITARQLLTGINPPPSGIE